MTHNTRVKFEDLKKIDPQTENQSSVFDSWDDGDNIILAGSAGTGKTFLAMYLALESVLTRETPYHRANHRTVCSTCERHGLFAWYPRRKERSL